MYFRFAEVTAPWVKSWIRPWVYLRPFNIKEAAEIIYVPLI